MTLPLRQLKCLAVAPTMPPPISPSLATDREWIAQQDGPATPAIAEQLTLWLMQGRREIGLPTLEPESDRGLAMLDRLWECWRFHWQTAVKQTGLREGNAVAQSIRAGVGFVGTGKLGGDVIADLILATAALGFENAALDRMTRLYAHPLQEKVGWRGRDPDWWNDFLNQIIGLADRTDGAGYQAARLRSYRGESGLGLWLKIAAKSYLIDRARTEARRKSSGPEPNWNTIPVPLVNEPETAECVELLTRDMRAALNAVRPEPRALMAIMIDRQVNQTGAARVLKRNPGTATRWREEAIRVLQANLRWNDLATVDDRVRHCLEALQTTTGEKRLAQALAELLSRHTGANPT